MGPWIVTADEIPDPSKLSVTTRVNGKMRQKGTTSEMFFSIPFLISYISQVTPLEPGDIITTGSPDRTAVDLENPPWLKAGDLVEVEIDGIGTLRNPVEAE
jgi:2-keto-4-pentenoate hydratase/2-oxohepta-3-ene-1,7-dioic acid hydratase in catechol pathway